MQNSKLVFQNDDSPVDRKDQFAQADCYSRDVSTGSSNASTSNDHQSTRCSNVRDANSNHNFSDSIDSTHGGNYENIMIGNNDRKYDGTGNYMKTHDDVGDSTYGTIRLNGTRTESQRAVQSASANLYENVGFSTTRNNDQNRSMPKKHSQLSSSCEMIENKLTISNDDLLEAIEQLSMLSKSKEICVTPKRNNSEKDNAKSNEVKADKERKQLEEEERKKYIEFLRNEKLHILGNMDALKRSVAEIEAQEEEINREVLFVFSLLSKIERTNVDISCRCCIRRTCICRILNELFIFSLHPLLGTEC